MAPSVGKVLAPAGFNIVRVDVHTGVIHDFAVSKCEINGPASKLGSGGLERPIVMHFDPSEDALYVVDFGVMTMTRDGPVYGPARECCGASRARTLRALDEKPTY
ncbi:MAG TPA: hypothetical protein VHJ19_03280 [Gammaproteobacteria bacterium]|nr:hypothetical protein [Gammaproteobacteria bacterium]